MPKLTIAGLQKEKESLLKELIEYRGALHAIKKLVFQNIESLSKTREDVVDEVRNLLYWRHANEARMNETVEVLHKENKRLWDLVRVFAHDERLILEKKSEIEMIEKISAPRRPDRDF